MAAPSLTIRLLAESENSIIVEGLISAGGTIEMAATKFIDMSSYTVGGASTSLSIKKINWSLKGMNLKLLFDADTDDEGIHLSRTGEYDFSSINGIKNPGSTGSTGDIMIATYGVLVNAALDSIGSIVLECGKIRS